MPSNYNPPHSTTDSFFTRVFGHHSSESSRAGSPTPALAPPAPVQTLSSTTSRLPTRHTRNSSAGTLPSPTQLTATTATNTTTNTTTTTTPPQTAFSARRRRSFDIQPWQTAEDPSPYPVAVSSLQAKDALMSLPPLPPSPLPLSLPLSLSPLQPTKPPPTTPTSLHTPTARSYDTRTQPTKPSVLKKDMVPFPRGGRHIGEESLQHRAPSSGPFVVRRNSLSEFPKADTLHANASLISTTQAPKDKKRHLFGRFSKKKEPQPRSRQEPMLVSVPQGHPLAVGSSLGNTAHHASSLSMGQRKKSNDNEHRTASFHPLDQHGMDEPLRFMPRNPHYFNTTPTTERKRSGGSSISRKGRDKERAEQHAYYALDRQATREKEIELNQNFGSMDGIVNMDYIHQGHPLAPNAPARDQAMDPLSTVESWAPPDSWAVQPLGAMGSSFSILTGLTLLDDDSQDFDELPIVEQDKWDVPRKNFCIRIFRPDDTFGTVQVPLGTTTSELLNKLAGKFFLENMSKYHLVIRMKNSERILQPTERPLHIQKAFLEQMGYTDQDRLEDVGRSDNSYLIRFTFGPKIPLPVQEESIRPHVDLQAQNLPTIPIYLYKNASCIVSLNLSKNLLMEVPVDFAQICTSLKELRLAKCDYSTLPPSVRYFPALEHLNVSSNRIRCLLHARLEEIEGLKTLRAFNNKLTVLPPSFQSFKHLTSLFVSNNAFTAFPEVICQITSLTYLDISFNKIPNFPDEIGNLTNLIALLAIANRINGSLPPSFAKLESLKELDIRQNLITDLDVLSYLPSLEIVSADYNSVSVINCELSNICQLKMCKNHLTYFNMTRKVEEIAPGIPQDLITSLSSSLVDLNLSNCKLSSLPEELFLHVTLLERLVLDSNTINSIPSSIGNLRRLTHLSVQTNNLDCLPVEIAKLSELKTLDAQKNNLKTLPKEIWLCTSLSTLNCSSNLLESFPEPYSAPGVALHLPLTPQAEAVVTPSVIANAASDSVLPTQLGFNAGQGIVPMTPTGESNHMPAFVVTEASHHGGSMEAGFASAADTAYSHLPSHHHPLHKMANNSSHSSVANTKVNGSSDYSSSDYSTGSSNNNSNNVNSNINNISNDHNTTIDYNDYSNSNSNNSNSNSNTTTTTTTNNTNTNNTITNNITTNNTTTTSTASTTNSAHPLQRPPNFNPPSFFASPRNHPPPLSLSLRQLFLGDNRLTDDVWSPLSLFLELRTLNLSFNDLYEIPPEGLCHQHLYELYLSGNHLTSLPADDIERLGYLRVLAINGNKLQTLPAEIGKLRKLLVLDVGNNVLKYNIANWPYDWNWNWNLGLKYLNLSGNKRLEIKKSPPGPSTPNNKDLSDFSALTRLHMLGLMDITILGVSVPEEHENCRVRTSPSEVNSMDYGVADWLGPHDYLATWDLVMPRFRNKDDECVFGLFDGRSNVKSGCKVTKFLNDHLTYHFMNELRKNKHDDTIVSAMRRTFLTLEKELGSMEEDSKKDAGASAVMCYISGTKLYVANVGDALAVISRNNGQAYEITQKHIPLNPSEISRIRMAGGFVSSSGLLNDELNVSRSFGHFHLIPVVNANPFVSTIELTQADEFVIMASRGLWDRMSYQTAVDIARTEKEDFMAAAQKLRDFAITYGAEDNLMVMVIGVGDLFQKREKKLRNRGNIGPGRGADGTGMLMDDAGLVGKSKRRGKEGPGDSTLARLEREVPPPIGQVALVFTDIKSSTQFWETQPENMRSAIKIHDAVMRRTLRSVGGYEVKTEGDAFMVCFQNITAALLWCFTVQLQLLEADWPAGIIDTEEGREIEKDGVIIYKGLSVRMGIHWGNPVFERNPITNRMDYFGPVVNKASRISNAADGGQICVSSDVVAALRTFPSVFERDDVTGLSEQGGSTTATGNHSVDRDLQQLQRFGFHIMELGERRLKGLETPELLSFVYPGQLAARMEVSKSEILAPAPVPAPAPPIIAINTPVSNSSPAAEAIAAAAAEPHSTSSAFPDLSLPIPFNETNTRLALDRRIAAATAPSLLRVMDPELVCSVSQLAIRLESMTSNSISNKGKIGSSVNTITTTASTISYGMLLDAHIKETATDEELLMLLDNFISRIENSISTLYLQKVGHFVNVLDKLGEAIELDPSHILRALQMYAEVAGLSK